MQATTGTRLSARLWVGGVIFFLSGGSALVYQVIWQRILGVVSGVHIYSITLIVTAFMAGLGFGGLAGGRLADRLTPRNAVLAFSACELMIGLFGFASPWLYYDVAYLKLGFLIRYPLLLPVVQFALLLLPTALMGASLPLLARGLVRETRTAASTIGVLYGVNALGAAAGALASAWYLIGAVGFVGAIRIGALLNLVAAGGALLLGRSSETSGSPLSPAGDDAVVESTPSTAKAFPLPAWCLIYGFSGFVALSFELLWFRVLDVTIKSSPYTFGHLLGLFLAFLALGSLFGSLRVSRWKHPELVFFWGQWAVSATAGAALLVLSTAPDSWLAGGMLPQYWAAQDSLEMSQLFYAFTDPGRPEMKLLLKGIAQVYLLLPLSLLAIPTFLMGLTFTCIQRAVQTDLREVGWRVGAVQTSNIVGSILGSLLTGAFFLAVVGTPRTAAILLVSGAVYAVMIWIRVRSGFARVAAAVAVACSLLIAVALPDPDRFWSRFHGKTLAVAEDASGLAVIQEIDRMFVTMRVNGKMHSMLPFGDEHTLFGIIPVLVAPGIRDALVIGLGSGNTAWAAAAGPDVQRVDVYEIVRPELDVLERMEPRPQIDGPMRHLLQDPRVHLTFSDGRLALRNSGRKYDLVEIDALEPSMAYSGNLYSREFFELCRQALNPGGICSTYVPTERTRRTVVSVFPHVLDFHSPGRGSFILASNEPLRFDPREVRDRLSSEPVQRYLNESGGAWRTIELLERFLEEVEVTTIDDSNRDEYLVGDVNTDLFPRDEFDKTYDGSYE